MTSKKRRRKDVDKELKKYFAKKLKNNVQLQSDNKKN